MRRANAMPLAVPEQLAVGARRIGSRVGVVLTSSLVLACASLSRPPRSAYAEWMAFDRAWLTSLPLDDVPVVSLDPPRSESLPFEVPLDWAVLPRARVVWSIAHGGEVLELTDSALRYLREGAEVTVDLATSDTLHAQRAARGLDREAPDFDTETLMVRVDRDRWTATDRASGEVRWTRVLTPFLPARIDDDVVLRSDERIRRVSLASGEDVWSMPCTTHVELVAIAGRLFGAISTPPLLFELDPADGRATHVRVAPHGRPIAFVGDLLALEAEDGLAVVDWAHDDSPIRAARSLDEDVERAVHALAIEGHHFDLRDYPANRAEGLAFLERMRPIAHDRILRALEDASDSLALVALAGDPEPSGRDRLWSIVERSFGEPTVDTVALRERSMRALRLPIPEARGARLRDETLAWIEAARGSDAVDRAVEASLLAIERSVSEPAVLAAVRTARRQDHLFGRCGGATPAMQARSEVIAHLLAWGVRPETIGGGGTPCVAPMLDADVSVSEGRLLDPSPLVRTGDSEWDDAPTYAVGIQHGDLQGSSFELLLRCVRGVWRLVAIARATSFTA